MIWIGHKTHQFAYEMVYIIALELLCIEVEQAVLLEGHTERIRIRIETAAEEEEEGEEREEVLENEEEEEKVGEVIKKLVPSIYELKILLLFEANTTSDLMWISHSKLNRGRKRV